MRGCRGIPSFFHGIVIANVLCIITHEPFTMQNMNAVVTVVGIIYGFVLILTAFRIGFFESMRIDALVMPQPTESTRPVNLVAGLLIAGYGIYSLLGS